MRHNNKKTQAIIVLILVSLNVILFGSSIYLWKQEKKETYSYTNLGEEKYNLRPVYIEVTNPYKWQGVSKDSVGSQYDFTLFNNTTYEIIDWKVQVSYPVGSYIDSTWNGKYSIQGEGIYVTPVEYNQRIESQAAIPFGMVVYTPKDFRVKEVSIEVVFKKKITDIYTFWLAIIMFWICLFSSICYLITQFKMKDVRKQREWYRQMINEFLQTFANVIDAKDKDTVGHSLRVAAYSRALSKRMNMSLEEQEWIYYIALMHDIGKIGIPDAILQKPAKLEADEYEIIKRHTIIGGEILKDLTAIEEIACGAKYHHEHYDGSGYPEGLKGEEIPLYARIICVADSYDVMANKRCYKKALDKEQIIKELKRCSGIHFDPKIVEKMLEILAESD